MMLNVVFIQGSNYLLNRGESSNHRKSHTGETAMKTSIFRLLALCILVFAAIVGIQAQEDDQGNLNDPNSNDRANACYEGGSMAGQCDTMEEWEAGYYLIRWEYGLITLEQFPDFFNWALPDYLFEEASESAASNCFVHSSGSKSLLYSGASGVAGNFEVYSGADCSGSPLGSSNLSTDNPIIIVAASSTAAGTLCQTLQDPLGYGIDWLSAYGYDAPTNIYVCIID
jgi:hypothetical protein